MSDLKMHLAVRGSKGINFQEGCKTGNMTQPGLLIETVYYAENNALYGGCIDRAETKQLYEFLGRCIAKWDSEE